MIVIGRHNPKIKDMRRLRRRQGDRALLEGPHLVFEALAAGIALDSVLATPEFLATPAGRHLAARLASPPLPVAPEALESLCDADAPRGVVAVATLARPQVAELALPPGAVVVFADGLQDPGNLGALARVAEAAGADAIVLAAGSVHPNHPRALRASAGSLLRLPVAAGATPEALDGRFAQTGDRARWVVLAVRDGEPLWSAPLAGSLVLAVGAEGPGVSATVAARADGAVTIPMRPPVESLNAVVATALVLFEIRRRVDAGALSDREPDKIVPAP